MNITLDPGAKTPERSTRNAAGYDLFSLEDVLIPPGTHKKIDTGVHIELPVGIVGTISHRSGMNSKQGIQAYGRVDADYRGTIGVTLFNADPSKEARISVGDRIAQLVFVQIWHPSLETVDKLTETKRGVGGHGSSGK